MNDEELRALVRTAIAQFSGGHAGPAAPGPPTAAIRLHPSHGRFTLLAAGSDADGPCLIEPAVLCNHCGYCQSYGH